MDPAVNSAPGPRRDEDIALDLFKFVATTAAVGRPGAASTGFVASSATKPEDHVNLLLDLYTRCLKTVTGRESAR
ncbi:MAG TPA: hypothetical protein VE178_02725 [Silvibacterium sp.]|nr:hypothetical protein [Silvibacterium sp.]